MDKSIEESEVKDPLEEMNEEAKIKMEELVALVEKQVISTLLETEIQYLSNEVFKRDKSKEIGNDELPKTENE